MFDYGWARDKLFREGATYCTRVKIKNDVCVPAKSELLLESKIENEIGESSGLLEPYPIKKLSSAYGKVFFKSKKGKVCISVINTNRKDAILNRDMLVASLSSVDCIKEKSHFKQNQTSAH